MKRLLSLVAVTLVAAASTVAAAAPASAYTISVSASIQASGCTSWLSWSGQLPTGTNLISAQPNKGTVRHCATKLKLSDSNSSADYFVIDLKSEWTTSQTSKVVYGSGSQGWPADPTSLSVSSNATTRSNEYGATPTKTVSSSCGNLSVGVNVGVFSIGTTLDADCGSTVTRTTYATKSAAWKIDNVTKWDSVEVAFVQAVNQGVKPTFTATFARPNYTYTKTVVKDVFCRQGCIDGFKLTANYVASAAVSSTLYR